MKQDRGYEIYLEETHIARTIKYAASGDSNRQTTCFSRAVKSLRRVTAFSGRADVVPFHRVSTACYRELARKIHTVSSQRDNLQKQIKRSSVRIGLGLHAKDYRMGFIRMPTKPFTAPGFCGTSLQAPYGRYSFVTGLLATLPQMYVNMGFDARLVG